MNHCHQRTAPALALHLQGIAPGPASRADTAKGGDLHAGVECSRVHRTEGAWLGGFGNVMLARHDASGTPVAIKYLRHDLLADQEFAEMFRSEATVLASMDDLNVVRLYEYVESPSGAAIVMELVDGITVREILTHQGNTTAEAALVVLHGSLMGLAAAHQRGVVHRDYKPENVLVNGEGISKLTDFGIAARTGDRAIPAGSLLYAAPEQIAGAVASPASDVYAVTATFYECLTGRPPFNGQTAAELVRQHRSEPVPLDPVPGPLRSLVAAGMAKDPWRTGRCHHLRHRTRHRCIRRLRPGLARARPVAPGRGSTPAGGTVAVWRATRGTGIHRAPDLPAPAFQRSQSSHRGRYRDRGRGGGHGSRCYRFAHAQRPESSRGGGEADLAPAVFVFSLFVRSVFVRSVFAVGVAVLASADLAITRARADAVIVVQVLVAFTVRV